MEINTQTHFAIRMATGAKVHLKESGASATLCSTWTGNTRQYRTDDTVVTCTKCWRRVMAMTDRAEQVAALGFTNQEKGE